MEDDWVSTKSKLERSHRAIHTLKLVGEYDVARKPELELAFASIGSDGPVVLDMINVTDIDSTFLRALASLHFRFSHPITLIVRSEGVKSVLRVVKFDELFRIIDF